MFRRSSSEGQCILALGAAHAREEPEGARVVAFADLGMNAIYAFDVKDMPGTVAVDARGTSVHHSAPREWQARIGTIPVAAA